MFSRSDTKRTSDPVIHMDPIVRLYEMGRSQTSIQAPSLRLRWAAWTVVACTLLGLIGGAWWHHSASSHNTAATIPLYLEIQVVDRLGRPVAGAEISSPDTPTLRGRSDAFGLWKTFGSVAGSASLRLRAEKSVHGTTLRGSHTFDLGSPIEPSLRTLAASVILAGPIPKNSLSRPTASAHPSERSDSSITTQATTSQLETTEDSSKPSSLRISSADARSGLSRGGIQRSQQIALALRAGAERWGIRVSPEASLDLHVHELRGAAPALDRQVVRADLRSPQRVRRSVLVRMSSNPQQMAEEIAQRLWGHSTQSTTRVTGEPLYLDLPPTDSPGSLEVFVSGYPATFVGGTRYRYDGSTDEGAMVTVLRRNQVLLRAQARNLRLSRGAAHANRDSKHSSTL